MATDQKGPGKHPQKSSEDPATHRKAEGSQQHGGSGARQGTQQGQAGGGKQHESRDKEGHAQHHTPGQQKGEGSGGKR